MTGGAGGTSGGGGAGGTQGGAGGGGKGGDGDGREGKGGGSVGGGEGGEGEKGNGGGVCGFGGGGGLGQESLTASSATHLPARATHRVTPPSGHVVYESSHARGSNGSLNAKHHRSSRGPLSMRP